MIKQQNSSRNWSQIRTSALMLVSVFFFVSFIFIPSASAVVPKPRTPVVDPLTDEQQGNAACQRKYQVRNTQAIKACTAGYVGAVANKKVDEVCKGSPSPDACNNGFQIGDKGYADDDVEDATSASQSYCNGKFPATSTQQGASADRLDNINTCKAGYEAATDGKTAAEACGDLSGDKKAACEKGAAAGKTGKDSGKVKAAKDSGDGDKDASNPDCETSLSSPLSWILCPIVDLGSNVTDFVFTTFVRGLLEDVPIVAENGNGSFEAWKQFRTLGNVVLLGTLLAVVYSQARNK